MQEFHWNRPNATVHPFVVYIREDNEVKHQSYVIISDIQKQDSITVHLFIKKLIAFLNSKFKTKKQNHLLF
jgi:hypothetical protein